MHYVPRLLRNTDTTEMTLFHYSDGRPSEVLLGWQGDKETDCIIAKISDPIVVEYFQREFEHIWSKARRIGAVGRRDGKSARAQRRANVQPIQSLPVGEPNGRIDTGQARAGQEQKGNKNV
jgi:hypothetical protein